MKILKSNVFFNIKVSISMQILQRVESQVFQTFIIIQKQVRSYYQVNKLINPNKLYYWQTLYSEIVRKNRKNTNKIHKTKLTLETVRKFNNYKLMLSQRNTISIYFTKTYSMEIT